MPLLLLLLLLLLLANLHTHPRTAHSGQVGLLQNSHLSSSQERAEQQ
jgi:hypothetical protein